MSGFADFENTVDRGSAVNFGADSGLCLSWCKIRILGPKRNWIVDRVDFFFQPWSVSFKMSSAKLFLFFERSSVKLKGVVFFTICKKLTMAFMHIYQFDNRKPIFCFTCRKGVNSRTPFAWFTNGQNDCLVVSLTCVSYYFPQTFRNVPDMSISEGVLYFKEFSI